MKTNNLFFNAGSVFLILSFILTLTFLNAQSYCSTPATMRQIEKRPIISEMPFNLNHYCLKVYFHVIQTSSGVGDQTQQTVEQAFQILSEDFAPHNISFFWDGYIDFMPNEESGPVIEFVQPGEQSIFNINNHSDGINIYLFSDNNMWGFGQANGIATSGELLLAGKILGQSVTTSHVISHEMGHILGLWHTHHGTFDHPGETGNDPTACAEFADGSNSNICGDYILDTPADPNLDFNVQNNSCAWNLYGTVYDTNNPPMLYNPSTKNFMAYTSLSCMEEFTTEQGNVMRNTIETMDFLQNALMSSCLYCEVDDNPDLVIKDSDDDLGLEPNEISPNTWSSPDIWIRNTNDGETEHQNPKYETGFDNYIYVRIKNKNCDVFYDPNAKLKVYWSKANISNSWPESWNGGTYNEVLTGDLIEEIDIPQIDANEEIIIPIKWDNIPDPMDYENIPGIPEPWHFCLLARIVSDVDSMAVPETSSTGYNIRQNNNIASKNVTIIKVDDENQSGGTVAVYNPYNYSHNFDIKLYTENREEGTKIFEEAEVTIKLSPGLYNSWQNGGSQKTQIETLPVSLGQPVRLKVTGDNARLKNIYLGPGEMQFLSLTFNFLTQEVTSKPEFHYQVSQTDATTQEIMGGNEFLIEKPNRDLFTLSDNEVSSNKNQNVTLQVNDIYENAVYNWYDEQGNLVYTGKDYTTMAETARKFKVEVIAEADGFKDYAEVDLKMNPHHLESITPNPTSNNINITYNLNSPASAYISITGYIGNDTGIQRNYTIGLESNELNIDITEYATGYYAVSLVCDGQVVESKNLIKQ